jgi:hypothetical protein
MNLFKEYKIH